MTAEEPSEVLGGLFAGGRADGLSQRSVTTPGARVQALAGPFVPDRPPSGRR
jgi:hypothetical protein